MEQNSTMKLLLVMVVGVGVVSTFQSHRDRGDKTAGVNGGSVYFDAQSGEFRRFPENVAAVEVIKRTPIRTLNSGGIVNKVLKRRKKYRRLPLRREDDNTASDESLEEDDRPELREIINDSFEKLPPLRAKYKTSDSIRMNRQIVPDNLSRYSKSSQTISQNNRDNQGKIKSTNYNPRKTPEAKHHVELSDKFRFKQKIKEPRKSNSKYFEQVGAESREEKVYRPYFDDDDDDVLVASGYHNTISIQEPLSNGVSLQDPAAYDFTIGKIIIILGLTVKYFLP